MFILILFTNNPVRDDPDMEESSMIAADILVGGTWAIGTTSNLISALTPESTESLYAMYKKEYDEMKEEQRREELEKAAKRASQNITYGKWAENVRNDEIAIGMPAWIVEDIMGTPDDTDRTVTSYGTSETWYYERYDYDLGMYWTYLSLYFDDGILTSWHEW